VRTFRYTGLSAIRRRQPDILYAYSFIPKQLDRSKGAADRAGHGGVHSNHMTGGPANAATIVRELIDQGYVVVAPDYRGSTGYGPAYAKAIDYGGKENDDVLRPATGWWNGTHLSMVASRSGRVEPRRNDPRCSTSCCIRKPTRAPMRASRSPICWTPEIF